MKITKNRQIKMDLATIEQDFREFFLKRNEITLAYLFGSSTDKLKNYIRDIDVAVLVTPDKFKKLDRATPYGYMAQLNAELAHRVRSQKVDLVILNNAPPVLLKEVIGKGKVIYCVSENERIKFETSALQRHADTLHLRKIKRLYMKKRIAEGLTAYHA